MPITFIKWDVGNLIINSQMIYFVAIARNVTSSQNQRYKINLKNNKTTLQWINK